MYAVIRVSSKHTSTKTKGIAISQFRKNRTYNAVPRDAPGACIQRDRGTHIYLELPPLACTPHRPAPCMEIICNCVTLGLNGPLQVVTTELQQCCNNHRSTMFQNILVPFNTQKVSARCVGALRLPQPTGGLGPSAEAHRRPTERFGLTARSRFAPTSSCIAYAFANRSADADRSGSGIHRPAAAQ